MKGPAIDKLIHRHLFPNPKSTDPISFHAFLQRQLIPEVRLETAAFYGDLDSREAQYPGLNYCYAPHRMRLSRFTWHRRLFRAFDQLGLTESEIMGLTKWEGTLWARRRFERENGVMVRDTTGEEIVEWVPPSQRQPVTSPSPAEEMEEDSVSEEEQTTISSLDERLRIAVQRRQQGSAAMLAMTEEWEQWLKEASENGSLSPSLPNASPEDIYARLMESSRATQWNSLPEYLQHVVRQTIETNRVARNDSGTSTPSASEGRASATARPPIPRVTVGIAPWVEREETALSRVTLDLTTSPARAEFDVPTSAPRQVGSAEEYARLVEDRNAALRVYMMDREALREGRGVGSRRGVAE